MRLFAARNVNEPMRVAQVPITARSVFRNSFVYQNVHWSDGSTVSAL
jgi:hypothetical protein